MTTAIVTTPFFKTGRPLVSVTQLRRIDEAASASVDERSAGARASVGAKEVPNRRWLWMALAFAVALAAGAAALAYQRLAER